MSSQSPESKSKTPSKVTTLNPDANPFHIPPPHSLSGAQLVYPGMETQALPPVDPSTEGMVFPLAYNYENHPSSSLQPMPLQVLRVFPDYDSGIWYIQPGVAYLPHSIWPSTPNFHPHLIYQNPCMHMDQWGNEEALDTTHGSTLGAENRKNDNFSEMISAKIYRSCQGEFSKGYDNKTMLTERVHAEWRPKDIKDKLTEKNSGGCSIPFPRTMEEAEIFGITTVMIRNIPNNYQFQDLLVILDDHCSFLNNNANRAVWSMFDSVHLPVDLIKHARTGKVTNLGYAFVNFTTASAAYKFYQRYHRHAWSVDKDNKKICEITIAEFQGKEAFMKKFSQKIFRSKSLELRPVVYSIPRHGFNREIEGTFLGKFVNIELGRMPGS